MPGGGAIVRPPMPRLTLTLLGGFHARLSMGPPLVLARRKAQALLAYLALPLGQPHPRDKLAALLWGDSPEEKARIGLRQVLFNLRQTLAEIAPEAIRINGETVALDATLVDLDVAEFERRLAEGTSEALERGVALYQGDLLAGLAVNEPPFEEWLLGERERLRELAVDGLAQLLARQRASNMPEAAIQTALRLLTLDPLQEAVHRALMRCYVQLDRRSAALRQYQQCVAVLQRELGVAPEAATQEIYREILREVPSRRRRGPDIEADRLLPTRGPRPELPPPEIPLRGRTAEMTTLRAALEEALAGRGGLVAILGEAGIGKTRLLQELLAEAQKQGYQMCLGRAHETDQILPFGPWVDALGAVPLGGVIHDLDPLRRAELARLFPECGVQPQPGGPPAEMLKLFEAVATLIKGLARRQPLLLLLEDLHWADEMSLRLVAFLGRRLKAWPVVLLVTLRPEEVTSLPFLDRTLQELSHERHLVVLEIGPLSRTETEALVEALARPGSAPATVVTLGEALWRASDGNPFVIVETMRALGEASLRDASARLPLPRDVSVLISQRLERLAPASRQLLVLAAVVGREFDFWLLQRASDLGEEAAAEAVEELVRRRIFHGVGEHFDFTHEVIRQVALTQVLVPRRRLLHRRVAEALEAGHAGASDSVAGAIGRHYHEGAVWLKAVPYLLTAGRQALERSAYREALGWFELARTTVGHLPESRAALEQAVDVRVNLFRALVPLGERTQVGEHLREAEVLARRLDDPQRLGWVTAVQANHFWLAGDLDRGLEAATLAASISEDVDDAALTRVATFFAGVIRHFRGDYRGATAAFRRNRAAASEPQTPEYFGVPGPPTLLSASWLGWSLAELGDFAEGTVTIEDAVRAADALDHGFTRADAYRAAGSLYVRQGNLARAVDALERGLDLVRRADLALWFPSIGSVLGCAYTLSGRLPEATGLLERALEQAERLGISAGHALRTVWLAEVYLAAGRVSEARPLADRALTLAQVGKEGGNEGWALRLAAEIAGQRDLRESEDFYARALALAGERGMRPLAAHCHAGLARLYRQTGERERTQEHLGTARMMYREMAMSLWLDKLD